MNTRADNYLETLYLPSARDKYIECEDSRVLTVWELCILSARDKHICHVELHAC